jgi:hypothetical protein
MLRSGPRNQPPYKHISPPRTAPGIDADQGDSGSHRSLCSGIVKEMAMAHAAKRPEKSRKPNKAAPPDRETILGLVGEIDDAAVLAIQKTGATYVEVEEAARWAAGETTDPVERKRHPLTGPAAAVYDILVTEPELEPPPDDR